MESGGQVQRRAISDRRSGEVPEIVYEVLRSHGKPLDGAARKFMEPRLGYDFSQVRVHDDAKAAESAKAVDAHAYTVGQHIVFGNNKYSPGSRFGGHLLFHELAHVVQQSAFNEVPVNLAIDDVDSTAEHEAERAASHINSSRIGKPMISRRAIGMQRASSKKCFAAFDLFQLGGAANLNFLSSIIGTAAEKIIEAHYCSTLGCSIMRTDYFDNPIPASYVAFLVAHNRHLDNARDIAALSLIGISGLNRPDILTDRPDRKELYEIKARSATGIAKGIAKLQTIRAFMDAYALPYSYGTTFKPSPPEIYSTTVMAGPWPITASFRVELIAPGLLAYDFCFEGELEKVAIAALILALLALLIALQPELLPLLTPALERARQLQ